MAAFHLGLYCLLHIKHLSESALLAETDIHHLASTRENPSSGGYANNKGPDQPAHLHSLISAFVIHFLEIVISKLATGEISMF